MVVPKTLSNNSGLETQDVIIRLQVSERFFLVDEEALAFQFGPSRNVLFVKPVR